MKKYEWEDDNEYAERMRDRAEELKGRRAVVVDGSDYLAALMSREDFGCVLYEPHPANS